MSKSDDHILKYQQRCFREHGQSIGLPVPYTYPEGNSIRPLPPIQTRTGGLMIVGAYPSARFEQRLSVSEPKRYRVVPVADNLQPFAEEQYFDGVQVRTLTSGDGLRGYLLNPLGLNLKDCWVTDLVKVFLYKEDHRASCGAVFPGFAAPVLRDRYLSLAEKSLPWLKEECDLCQPRLVVTLGEEVAKVVTGEKSASADDLLTREAAKAPLIGNWPVLCLPHPDACRRMPKWAETMAARVKVVAGWLNGEAR
jgi:uracil-DNA glycosylase